MRQIAFPALLVLLLGNLPADAQSVTQRAERDELFVVPNEDPTMAAAMRKARESLKGFLAQTRAPSPKMQGFAVKVAVREGGKGEYFWITPFQQEGDRF